MKRSFHPVSWLFAGALAVALVGCGQKDAATAEAKKAAAAGEAAAGEAAEAKEAAAPAKAAMAGLDGVPHIGSDDPKVVIIESSDFQ